MDRLKQTISRLEKEVDELKQFHKKTLGIPPSTGNVHYSSLSQEFGEYSLDEMDTFNFTVQGGGGNYIYTLINPTTELSAYLGVQGKTFSSGNWISIKPDDYEKYCMEQNGAPVVLTKEIRACLESRLWMYCLNPKPVSHHTENMDKSIKSSFSEDITISFKNIYQIFPHVSFYITPIMNTGITCITCSIKEITCKHVTFTLVNNTPKQQIPEGLTLHYHVNGIVEQSPVAELLN
jgi:hypothetical protein